MFNNLLTQFKKSKQPFEEYLKWIHAADYLGTDDGMPDSFETFIVNLEQEEVIEHANAFSKFLLDFIDNQK